MHDEIIGYATSLAGWALALWVGRRWERLLWQRRADATRLGIVRSLGRDVAARSDAVGEAHITTATYRRTRWAGDD